MLAHYDVQNGTFSFDKKTKEISENTLNALNKLQPGMIATCDNFEKLSKKLGTTDEDFINFCTSLKEGDIQLKQGQTYLQAYESQLKSTGHSFKNIGASAKNFFGSLGAGLVNTLGGMAIGTLVSTGISLVGKFIDDAIETEKERIEKLEEMAQKASEAKSNIESISSDMKNNIKTIDSIKDRYAELAQGVDTLSNKNLTLTTSEYEEFLDLTKQLSEVFPQLNMGIDDNGNAILDLNGDVNTITSSLQTLLDVEKQLAQQEIADNAGEYIANTLPQLKASYEDLEEQRKQFERDKARYSSVLDINSIGYSSGTNTIDVDKNISLMGADGIKSVLSEMGINKGWEAVYSNDKHHNLLGYKMELSTEDKNAIEKFYGSFVTETERNIKKSEAELARANKELSLMADYWLDNELSLEGLDGKAIYGNLQSDELQAGIKQMLNNVDWASLQITEGWDSEDDVYNYIIENILSPLESVEPEIRDSVYNNVIKAFTDTTISSGQRLEILKNLQSQFDKLGIEIDLSFKINELESQNDIIKNRLGFNKNASNATDAKRNQEIIKFWDSLEDEDKTLFLNAEIPDEVLKGNIEDWETHLKELQEIADENTITTHVELQTSADSMKSAFTDLQTALADYQENGLEGMDITNLTKLGDENTFGNIGGSTATYEKFLSVMHDIDATAEDVQEAFDELATAYIYNSELADKINESNVEWVALQLEKNNVINASAVAEQMLIDKLGYEVAAISQCTRANLSLNGVKLTAENTSEQLENATYQEIDALIAEANAAGVTATALIDYELDKIAASRESITTDGDISNLYALCTALGDASELVNDFIYVKQALNNALNSTSYVPSSQITALENQLATLQARIVASVKAGNKANTSSGGGGGRGVSGGSGGGSSSASETSETFDWAETKINRLEESIDRLDKTVNNTYTNWTNRNSALSQEMSKVREEISLQQQAYNRYMQEANRVGLSSTYARKIQSGELNIETIKDEGLINKINSYKEWYEKAVACSDAIQNLNIQLGELAQQQFDNIQQEYSDLISLIEGSADLVDERINRTEEQGYFASSSYYQQMLNYEAQEMARLKDEYNKLIDQRNAAVSSGAITQGSEAYQAMTQEIQGVHQAIEESTTAMVEFNNAIRDLNWEIFDYIEERIGKIAEESNFLIDLLDNQSLYNDNGSFNNRGQSAAYLHGQNAKIYTQQAQDYANELRKINADLAKDPSNKTLIERREELLDLQQESISNIYAEKEAVKSLVEEGINKHLQALTELIDKYKNAMSEAKSLYEYNKSISEQTSEISRLQKILQSYEGDDGEESRKAIQEYQNQLKEAEQSLAETEWERYISETENLLDDLYSDYEETLNARLDNIDTLFTDVINDANANAYMINETIKSVAQAVGYDISMINKNPQDIKNSIQQKTTSIPSLRGYATGSRYIDKDQLAWTQENGTEIIYRASDGALLTPLNQGDMVFTNEMSNKLFDIANGNLPDFMSGFKAPTMVAKANTTSVNNQNAISINLPNVTNYNEFKNALQKDSKFVGFMQEVTLGQALGKNKLNKNKF